MIFMWQVWFLRNHRVFEAKKSYPKIVGERTMRMLGEYEAVTPRESVNVTRPVMREEEHAWQALVKGVRVETQY